MAARMIQNKNIFLKELANMPELSNNTLSLVFAHNPSIDITRKEKFFDNILPFFKNHSGIERKEVNIVKSETESSIDKWSGRDLRIRNIRLKSIRGIPDSDKPYGINLVNENNQPQSLIILGSNGSGKSSLYSSLEYCYSQSIGEAQLRTFRKLEEGSEEFRKFLEHFDNGFSKAYCRVQVVDGTLDIQKENIPKHIRRIINPDTHFISDHDLYVNGQLDYNTGGDHSFHNTIARSLGLEELLDFEKNLKAFTLYRRVTEARNVASLEKTIKALETLINTNEKAITEKSIYLNNLKSTQEEIPEEKSTKDIIEKLNKIKLWDASITIKQSIIQNAILDFKMAYQEFLANSIQSLGYKELQFLNTGLELIKEGDDCPFCRNSKHDKSQIEIDVQNRITKIKSLNESIQNLNQTFNKLIDVIKSTVNELFLFRSKLNEEHVLIENDTAFNELYISEIKFIAYISNLLAEDFFVQSTSLNEDANFLKNQNKFLFDFTERNKVFIDETFSEILNTISLFQNRRLEIILQIEKALLTKQGQTVTEQVITTTKEINDLEEQIKESKKSIDSNNIEIKRIREQQFLFDKIKLESIEYLKVVHTELNKEVEKAFAPIKLIVEEILQGFIESEKRNIDLEISKQPESIDEETGEVLSEIVTARVIKKGTDSLPQSVNKYLNTFHYRLFLTMVGISVAIASRKKTKINLPLVLDDIFYASDFENRSTIEDFLKKVFAAFNEFTPELKLQLILFTHDQLIFESAIKAVTENGLDTIDFAKLFPYSDAKEEHDYLNLIYKLPKYLPQNLVKNTLTEV